MAEVQYNFQGAVWTYTYASGPDAGTVILQSPQKSWSDRRKLLVLRQANADAENRVWINRDPRLVARCGDRPAALDAHGVIARDGWARVIDPSCGSTEGDGAPLVPYHRGERVWVEQNLSPTDPGESVPVVSMDTLEYFRIPALYICFVPQLVRSDEHGNDRFATPAGPVHNVTHNGRRHRAQAYFECPSGMPQEAACKWDIWSDGHESPQARRLETYRLVSDVSERRRLFRQQWAILSHELGSQPTDDSDAEEATLPAAEVRSPGQSEYLASNLEGQLKLDSAECGSPDTANCCNLAPNYMVRCQVQVKPGYSVRLGSILHHHVQSSGSEHCPTGLSHQNHCVLWDNRARCVFENTAGHTCCVPLSEVIGGGAAAPSGSSRDIGLQSRRQNSPGCPTASEHHDIHLLERGSRESAIYMALFQKHKRNQQLQLERQRRQYQQMLHGSQSMATGYVEPRPSSSQPNQECQTQVEGNPHDPLQPISSLTSAVSSLTITY